MTLLDWDPTTSAGRLQAMEDFLSQPSLANQPKAMALLVRLRALRDGPITPEDERDFADTLESEITRSNTVIGAAWMAYGRALDAAVADSKRKGRTADDDAVAMQTTDRERANRLAENFAGAINAMRSQSDPGIQIRLAMEAVLHISELLRDIIGQAFTPQKRADQTKEEWLAEREKYMLANSEHIRKFLNFEVVSGLPIPLGALRNAWAHGDAVIRNEELHVFDAETHALHVRLTLKDIKIYVNLGYAAWYVFLIDGVVRMSRLHAAGLRSE